MKVEIYNSIHNLPSSSLDLFEDVSKKNFFLSKFWFECFEEEIAKDSGKLEYVVLIIDDEVKLIMPLYIQWNFVFFRKIYSLANYYTPYYTALSKKDLNRVDLISSAFELYFKKRKGWLSLNVFPVLSTDVFISTLRNKYRFSSYLYEKYINWIVYIENYQSYFESRPSKLKNTIKRKKKKLSADFRFSIFSDCSDIEKYIDHFFEVYNSSWKKCEPYEAFLRRVFNQASTQGAIRLGLVYHNETPVAAQVWFLDDTSAKIFKLAYKKSYAKYSVGTLLTDYMFRAVVENDNAVMIDYLTGDDNYKKDWMSEKRSMLGIMILNSKNPLSLFLIIKSIFAFTFRLSKRVLFS